jgi:hypothetical protein
MTGIELDWYVDGVTENRLGERADRMHQEVHREALTQRGTPEHRSAWERLLILVART